MTYKGTLVAGRDKPCLKLTATAEIRKLKVTVARTGKHKVFRIRRLGDGDHKTVCWREKPGQYHYQVSLEGVYRKRKRLRQVEVNIANLPPIKMLLDKRRIDLAHRKLTFQLNHPADRAELVIRGKGGKVLARVEETFGGAAPGSPLEMSWSDPGAPIVRMDLKAYSVAGFWVGMAMTPWAIEIPHEEVAFETDKWEIPPGEGQKLDHAVKLIRKALKEHASDLVVKLYVAGFTDTQGSAAHNRTLSTNRAHAIAAYFASKGLSIPVRYRGYGEEALAVVTRDNVSEARNRRAAYVLAAQPPVFSKTITWGKWAAVGAR